MYQGKYLANAKPVKAAPRQKQPEMPQKPARQPKQKKQKQPVTVGTVLFYCLYSLGILACAMGIFYGMGLLEDWLVRFEASQPDTVSKEFFAELFEEPDWGALYDRCGLEGTEFEGKAAYVRYMENKVGTQALTLFRGPVFRTGLQRYALFLNFQTFIQKFLKIFFQAPVS